MARESREIWARRVQDWLDSGLTCAVYAAQSGLNPHTLSNWRGKLQRAARRAEGVVRRHASGGPEAQAAKPETPVPSFVEVAAVAAAPDARVELELPNGCRLKLPAKFEAESVGTLVGVLLRRVPT